MFCTRTDFDSIENNFIDWNSNILMTKRIVRKGPAHRKRFAQTAFKLGKKKPWIASQLGLSERGVSQLLRHPSATKKATAARAKAIRAERIVSKGIGYTNASMAEIAERAGISERQVRRIVSKFGIERKYKLKTGPKGKRGKRLSEEQIKEIIRLRTEKNMSQEKIAERFNVSQPAINYILEKGRKNKT